MGNQNSIEYRGQATESAQPIASTSAQQPECPVPERYRNPSMYNVYAQRVNDPSSPPASSPLAALQGSDVLDPKNNMPLEPNQQPCPGQRIPLATDRVQSSIPKGGTEGTWLFPSPQMFFNALRRKGKGDDVREEDMDYVVIAHNRLNEMTWQRVLEWEQLHTHTCRCPTLLYFQGKPDTPSPRAWLWTRLGGLAPFDRHDWVVDRCGQEVRYVIDFYFHEDKAGTDQAFELDVRPALDSVWAAHDRVKMSIYEQFARWGLPCPVTGVQGRVAAQHSSSSVSAPSQSNSL